MRHRVRDFKVGRKPAHVRALLANQVCSLINEERIKTTVVKAKETKRLAEKMVTLGKKGTLHNRRQAISKLRDKSAVHKLFGEIAPRYINRNGGYTRIIRLGTRRGDAAETCFLEWVEDGSSKKKSKKADKKAEEAAPEAQGEEVVEAEADDTTEDAEATEEAEAAADEEAAADAEEGADDKSAEEAKEEEKKDE